LQGSTLSYCQQHPIRAHAVFVLVRNRLILIIMGAANGRPFDFAGLAGDVLGLPCYEAPEMETQIDHIEVPADNHLKFYLRDGRVEERIWKDRSRRESWTPEMKEKARQNAMKRKR